MAGAFNHNLNIVRPRPFCQFAEAHELLYLANIGSVGKAARPAGVAE